MAASSTFRLARPPPPPPPPSPAYEEALDRLSSLVTRRTRADASNKGDRFDLMFDYLKILDLEGPLSNLKVIHVAGTKGKGSTCSFAESILRNCGFRTGLLTSPHLIDIRERFRLDGMEISKDKFLQYFWWCWNMLQERTDDEVPMPNYFRFLTLLAFKMFSAEQVDVAILEVGLGGKFDSTNVVKSPVVCGISSLGYDHMEILGNTLGQIAGEKAGIFKEGSPAYTAPQKEEAMAVLKDKASQLGIPLLVVQPLSIGTLNGQRLGLDGEHQLINAGLAVALCSAWLKRTGHAERLHLDESASLPEQFIQGLSTTHLPGRGQIVSDRITQQKLGNTDGGLIFYLDGAHSQESLNACARWFSHAVKADGGQKQLHKDPSTKQILIFNCMSIRDPNLLLPCLVHACIEEGIYFQKAIFVPNQSVFNKVGSHALPAHPPEPDLSWQFTLQRVWEDLVYQQKGGSIESEINGSPNYTKDHENSLVLPSLPSAVQWLRDLSQNDASARYQEAGQLEQVTMLMTKYGFTKTASGIAVFSCQPVAAPLHFSYRTCCSSLVFVQSEI